MDINKASANFLHNMKRQRDMLKARETKASLISLRKQWLDKQKRDGYQSEYDRIRGLLEGSVLKGTTVPHLEKRKKDLENMDIVGMRPSKTFDNLY
jgi:hypothetical protein